MTNIKFISKVVEKLIFNVPIESQISVTGENGVSLNFLRMLLNTLAKTPRMFPHFLKEASSKQIVDYLERVCQFILFFIFINNLVIERLLGGSIPTVY